MSVTLVPHRVGEFGQVRQQLCLQAHWCQAEVTEQGLCSLAVLPVLRGKARERRYIQNVHLQDTLEVDVLNNLSR